MKTNLSLFLKALIWSLVIMAILFLEVIDSNIHQRDLENKLIATQCTLINKEIETFSGRKHEEVYLPRYYVYYQVNGEQRSAYAYFDILKREGHDAKVNQPSLVPYLNRFENLKEYPCWYNPKNPDEVVMNILHGKISPDFEIDVIPFFFTFLMIVPALWLALYISYIRYSGLSKLTPIERLEFFYKTSRYPLKWLFGIAIKKMKKSKKK